MLFLMGFYNQQWEFKGDHAWIMRYDHDLTARPHWRSMVMGDLYGDLRGPNIDEQERFPKILGIQYENFEGCRMDPGSKMKSFRFGGI